MSSTIATSKKATQAVTLAKLQALVSGLQKQLPSGQFTLLSTVSTTATLVQALQGTIVALEAVAAAHAALKAALIVWDVEEATMGPTILALRRTLQSMYANSPDILALFGMQPRKSPAPRTTVEKATAAAKAAATRKARGTTSKKQKAAITGNVTGVTITPIIVPASPDLSKQSAPAMTATAPAIAQ